MSNDVQSALTGENSVHGASSGEIARNALWRILEVIGSELLAFGFMVFLARILLPEDYGVVAIATVVLMIAQMTVYHGFAEAIIQKPQLDEREATSALWANIGIGLGLCLIIALGAFPFAQLLDKPLLGPVLLAMSPITILFGVTGIYQARVRRELRIKGLAIRTVVSVMAGGAIGLMLAWAGYGAWALVGQQLVHAAAGVAVLIWFTRWLPRPSIDRARIMQMARYGWHVMLTFLLDMVSRNIATIILGYFLVAELVGHFFVANRVFFSLAMLTFMSVNELCLPILARLQGERMAHLDGIHRCFRITALVCLPSFMGLALIAEPAILTLFGEKWSGAVTPLFVLSLFGICHGLTSLISQIFLSLDRPERASELTAVTGGLLLILVVPAASFGLTEATIAMGMAYLGILPWAVWRLRQVMPLDLHRIINDQAPIWLAALIMIAAAKFLEIYWLHGLAPVSQLAVMIFVSIIVFTATLRLTAPSFFAEVVGSLRAGLRSDEKGAT